MVILPNTSRINIIPWNHKVCFSQWLEMRAHGLKGPLCKKPTWQHGPTCPYPSRNKLRGPTPKWEAPHVIGGGQPTTHSHPSTFSMEACKEPHQCLTFVLDSMVVSSKGYEDVTMGPHKTTINTPTPSLSFMSQRRNHSLYSFQALVVVLCK
jgi:hypothetical protein